MSNSSYLDFAVDCLLTRSKKGPLLIQMNSPRTLLVRVNRGAFARTGQTAAT